MAKIADMAEKITGSVVGTYQKIEDKFCERFLEEDGSLKTGKLGEAVTEGYRKIEGGVVGGYKKIEGGVVVGFCKVNDKIVEKLFGKDDESPEEAKESAESEEE